MTESRELAHSDERPLAEAGRTDSASLLAMVAAAARDPSIDADKMEKMANLAIRLQDRERESEFNRAKIAAIMEMPSISKRGEILDKTRRVQSRYSKFEDMHRAIMPILAKHRLVLTFNVHHQGQMVSVQPILSHANGYVEKGGEMLLPIDTSGSKNNTQGAGSAASYGKRHSMKAMLNIIEDGEDIDGLGSLPDDQLNDRQARIVKEAEAARDEGTYPAYFAALKPADRAWLIQSGRHAELGGHTGELAGPEAQRKPSQAKAQPRPEPEPERGGNQDDSSGQREEPPAQEERPRMTAESWTRDYIAGLDGCGNQDALDLYMDEGREGIGKLRASKKDKLVADIEAAHQRARLRISSGPSRAGSASANESAGAQGGAGSLFGDE